MRLSDSDMPGLRLPTPPTKNGKSEDFGHRKTPHHLSRMSFNLQSPLYPLNLILQDLHVTFSQRLECLICSFMLHVISRYAKRDDLPRRALHRCPFRAHTIWATIE